jgi:hypothetical protein
MPQRTERSGKGLFHTLFLAAALSLLSAVVRRERRQLIMAAKARKKKIRVAPRRIAASLAFATLFFAGAALSAGAGNGGSRDRPCCRSRGSRRGAGPCSGAGRFRPGAVFRRRCPGSSGPDL